MVLIIVKVLAYKKLVKLAITMNNGVNVISLGWLYMCVQIHYCEFHIADPVFTTGEGKTCQGVR